MPTKKQSGIFLAVAGLIFCLASMAAAEAPICFIKGGNTAAPTGTPCTDGKTAYDNAKTLIKYDDGCSAPKTMDIIFQQEPGSATAVGGYQASMAYDPAQMSDPTCTLDPEDFFSDTAGLECPGTYQGTTTYIFGGEANISGDKWPVSNPNFILMGISFATFSIAEGATGTVTNFTTSAAKTPKVLDPDGVEVQNARIDADVICTAPPFFVKAPTAIARTQANTSCSGTPLAGTCDIQVAVTLPAIATGCENGTGLTVNCTTELSDGPGCTSRSVTVTRVSPSAATVGTADCGVGTSCTITDAGVAVGIDPTTYQYAAVANCVGGAALAKSAYQGSGGAHACGSLPQITSAAVDGVSFLQGQPIKITGTVTDDDTSKDGASALPTTVTLYYMSGSDTEWKSVTGTITANGLTGGFSIEIPGTAVKEKEDIKWAVAVTDVTLGVAVDYPAGAVADDTKASSIDGTTILVGTALDFVQGKAPYPNQMPFRAGGNQRLVIGFKTNEIAAVTMRLYTPQGTLIRQIENSTSDPENANNVCNWEKGCSWDGTTYKGTQLASNGLYIVNIYAVGTGENFGNQTINYTKGIVVMK